MKRWPIARQPRDSESMKRLYNWLHRFYGVVEANLGPSLDRALASLDPTGTRYQGDSVLEWACGSGGLGYRLLPRFHSYEGRDQSQGMLGRALKRWQRYDGPEKLRYGQAPFFEGDMVGGPEPGAQWDWIFMSFSLHLFDAETERSILARSVAHARKGVVVIDHQQKWQPVVALVERFEGSHYDQFLKMDFGAVAASLEVSQRTHEVPGLTIVEFLKHPSGASPAS